MEFRDDVRYLKTHEWFKKDGEIGSFGVSDFAQSEIGDVVFVELPEVGDVLTADKTCATVESVKAVFDIFAPASGEVIEVNEELLDAPEKLNEDAFGSWFVKFKVTGESPNLLDSAAYKDSCK